VTVVDANIAHTLQQTACDTRLMSLQLCFCIKSQLNLPVDYRINYIQPMRNSSNIDWTSVLKLF